jgi:sugar phosphate isomerase/epimerase
MIGKDRLAFMASLGYAKMEPRRVIEDLQNIGYGAVEWTLAHFDPSSKNQSELNELIRLTQDAGMETSEVVVQQDFVCLDERERRERIDRVKACIEAASEAGVKLLNVFTGPAPWDPRAPKIGQQVSEGQAWHLVVSAFEDLLPLAEQAQVTLALEAVFGMVCRDYYTSSLLIESFDSPFLCINMDPSHYRLYGNDPAWAVGEWDEKVVHVHLKDVAGTPGLPGETFIFPLLGEGFVDWRAFLNALNGIGYEGFLSVEFEAFRYYDTVLAGDITKAATLSMTQCEALLALQSED